MMVPTHTILSEHSICRISIANLRANVSMLKARLGEGSGMGAVIKSNAYGHGLRLTACALRDLADLLVVFSIKEALAVRAYTGDGRILVVGPPTPDPSDLEEALRQDLELTLANGAWLGAILAASERSGMVAKLHLKLETGTNRQGMSEEDLLQVAALLKDDPRVEICAISTHFADIEDTLEHNFAQAQLEAFNATARRVEEVVGPELEDHCANSAATLLWPRTHGSFVRAGLAVYGLWPSRETFLALRIQEGEQRTPRLKPVMEWCSRISEVRNLSAGDYVGYGRSYRCTAETRIAVVPVGYADGYSRALSNVGHMLVSGVRAPIRGRVCMNMTMIDVTDIPGAQIGSEVVLLGARDGESISAEQLADWTGTINYEVCTTVAASVPRIAVDVPEELRADFEQGGIPIAD